MSMTDYTALANDYDRTRYETESSMFIDSFREEVFLKLLNPNKDMKLLDVGTGTGSGIIYFANKVKKLTGLDGTQAMLDFAQTKIDEGNIKNTELVCANALDIPFENETFDNVVSLNFVHLFAPNGVSEQEKFVSEMERVVKKNGAVIVEFDNVMYARELGNKYSDLFKMSSSLVVDEIIGTYLPKTKLISSLSQPIAKSYGRLAQHTLFKRFAYKWVVKYIKA